MKVYTISEETLKVCLAALAELPIKVAYKAFTELSNQFMNSDQQSSKES